MQRHTGLILVLLAFSPVAFGQTTIYRSTMPDGRTVLGDRPTPGATKTEEIYVPKSQPPAPPPAAARAAGAAKANDAAAKSPAVDRTAKLGAAIAELRRAEEALRAAEAARVAGQAPTDGERLGTAGGASRLSDDYFKRQTSLDDAVDAAEKRVTDAQLKVRSLR